MLGKQRGHSTSKNRTSNSGSGTAKLQKHNSTGSSSSSPETTISIPHIKTLDNAKQLPKYAAALQRSPDDHFPADDLDAVQLELESLLSTVALRYRVLKSELEALDKAEDRREREKKSKHLDRPPGSPGKKKRMDDKLGKIKEPKYSSGGTPKLAKLKSSSTISSPLQQTDDSMDGSHLGGAKDSPKLALPKNDAPSRFWLSVEPYCMPITQEDIKLLDDLIEDCSNQTIPPIPDLGAYYTTKWAMEDLKNEQDNSNPSKTKKSNQQSSQNDVFGLMKNGEKLMGENITGPLTQRLVSALMEENLMNDNDKSYENGSFQENHNFQRLKNGISIERRVKQELINHGLLDEDDLKSMPEDEILLEIKRVRTELAAISDYNSTELKKLHSAAKEEIKRLEVKRKLDSVDQEIIETYKKISAAKQKRRPITQQEKDEVYRLTQEQKRLSDLLELMPLPGNMSIG